MHERCQSEVTGFSPKESLRKKTAFFPGEIAFPNEVLTRGFSHATDQRVIHALTSVRTRNADAGRGVENSF